MKPLVYFLSNYIDSLIVVFGQVINISMLINDDNYPAHKIICKIADSCFKTKEIPHSQQSCRGRQTAISNNISTVKVFTWLFIQYYCYYYSECLWWFKKMKFV
jgi:hypothetical protein